MTDTDTAPTPAPVTPPGPVDLQELKNDDLVYVDPEARIVVGRVEWNKNGNPKALLIPERVPDPSKPDKDDRRRGGGKRYYPWGTFKSMKNVYRLEGKQKKTDPGTTLDDVMQKALEQPFWD